MAQSSVEIISSAQSAPRHIAIIMDGNHRWARERRVSGAAGHRAGADRVRPIAEACVKRGLECLTLFAFSTENWQRPRTEVNLLLQLMRRVIRDELNRLGEYDIRVRIIGDRSRFSKELQASMREVESSTERNTGMVLNIAANYGGHWDIVQAARRLAEEVRAGRLAPADIDEAAFAARMQLADLPRPDICVRTGGDHRISNFLLWDFAYTEFYFSDVFWPDFGEADLDAAINSFVCRERRFGGRE